MEFKSIGEIERHFRKQIDQTEDADAKTELRIQMAETKAEWREQQADIKAKDAARAAEEEMSRREEEMRSRAEARENAARERERQAWIREAFVDFPLAKELSELVVGDSEESIKTAAQAAHERVAKWQGTGAQAAAELAAAQGQSQEELVAAAQQNYGAVTGAGGGTAVQQSNEVEERMQNYAEKYNNGMTGQFFNERDVSKAETDRYVADRGGPHLYEQLLRVAKIKYGQDSPMVTGRQ